MGPGWLFDEHANAGAEHLDPAEVERFDEKLPFDPSDEIRRLRELGLTDEDTVVDFGAGTGVFALGIADCCDEVIAVDISEQMLATIDQRAAKQGIVNISTVNAGFLTYEHRTDPAQFVFSKDALHHLPDFWKVEALKTIGQTLAPGGVLRLRDFVFSFDPQTSSQTIAAWIAEQREETSFTDEEINVHFREEYSTYGFLLERMLAVAGFEVLEAAYPDPFYAEYVCQYIG